MLLMPALRHSRNFSQATTPPNSTRCSSSTKAGERHAGVPGSRDDHSQFFKTIRKESCLCLWPGWSQTPAGSDAGLADKPERTYPDFVPTSTDDIAKKSFELMTQVNWDAERCRTRKDAVRQKLSCAKCHGGSPEPGTEPHGDAKRFPAMIFFAAIIDPNRDISPRYQTTSVVSKTGRSSLA